jgi:hypothetical protein
MKKRLMGLVMTGALLSGLITPLPAEASRQSRLWEDLAGDAGNQGTSIPGATQGGFDLVGGSIKKVKQDLEFSVEVAEMPSTGSLPEGFRFLWHFAVDGEGFRLTIKSHDIGKPDLVAEDGDDRLGRVDMEGHFRLEECYRGDVAMGMVSVYQCSAIEYVSGAFDPSSKTFTAVVPMKLIKAKIKSVISGGTDGSASDGCQICWITHTAERSLTPHTIIDSAVQTATYRVPGKGR